MKRSFSSPLLAILITFFFFAPKLINGKIPIPADSILNLYHPFRDLQIEGHNAGRFPAKNPFINDPVLQTYEWRSLVIKNLKLGKLPLWNPYSFSGTPLLANLQSAPFQISNVLFLILPLEIAWGISVIAPSVLITVFMYLFLKELNISKIASIYGAFILPLSSFFMPWLTWGTIVTTAMWLPLILYSIQKLNSKISALWFLALTLSVSQTIFSGHAQTALYIFIGEVIFIIHQYVQNHKAKPILFSFLAIFLGVLISSVQTLPFLEFVKLSARSVDQGYFQGRQDWFLPIQNLIQLLAPDFFGNPATNNYWGIWNYWEFVSFIGIVPLTFAILAILKRSKLASIFIILAGISLLFALSNPISKIPYILNFPFIATLQPSRIIFLLVFSLVALSAIGFDQFIKEKKSKFFYIPLTFISVLIILMIYSLYSEISELRISQRNLIIPLATCVAVVIISLLAKTSMKPIMIKFVIILVYAVTILELFRFGYKFTPFSKLNWIFPQTRIMSYLEKQERPFRIMTTDRRILHPNISSIYNIESVDGYDPLFLASYDQLVSVWQSGNPNSPPSSFNRIVTPQNIDSQLTNLLNVKYVLTFDEIKNPNFVKVMEEGQTKLYQNSKAQPRVFFADEVTKVDSDKKEFTTLLTNNPHSAVSQDFNFPKQNIDASLEIEKYDDQSIMVSSSTNKSVPLVLANPYYPGWNVYIDGQKDKIQKIDYMFQSVMVTQGTHSVEFKFESHSFYNGLILSGMGIILTFLTTVVIWKRKYQ